MEYLIRDWKTRHLRVQSHLSTLFRRLHLNCYNCNNFVATKIMHSISMLVSLSVTIYLPLLVVLFFPPLDLLSFCLCSLCRSEWINMYHSNCNG